MKFRFLTKNRKIRFCLWIVGLLSLGSVLIFYQKEWKFLLGTPYIFAMIWIIFSDILLRNKKSQSVSVLTHACAFILTVVVVVVYVVYCIRVGIAT